MDPADYTKFFSIAAQVSCLHNDFLLHSSLAKAHLLLVSKGQDYHIFFQSEQLPALGKAGIALYGTPQRFEALFQEFQDYVEEAKEVIAHYNTVPETMTLEEFSSVSEFLGRLWYYYGFAEFPYLDEAYSVADEGIKERLERMSTFKFTAREIMNAYFFKDGVIDNLLAYLSKTFLKEDWARYLYREELLALFSGELPPEQLILERKECYAATVIDGKITHFSSAEAQQLFDDFTKYEPASKITGVPANPGVAKGRAVVVPMLNNEEAIAAANKTMHEGDILIAESTSPDIILLCKKASAIVAEQGGFLSHAAVVSRELGVPCIIQAFNATRNFKTGDKVAVDADKGIISKII